MNFICGGMKKAAIYKPIKSKIMNEKPFRMFPNVMQMLASVGAKKCLKFMQIISRCCAESFQSKAEFEQYWANVEQMSSRTSAEFAQLGILKINLWEHHKSIINGSKGASYGSLGGAPKGNQNARKNNPHSIQNNENKNNENKNNETRIERIESDEMEIICSDSLYQRASDFKNSLSSFMTNDNYEIIEAFARYWTEPTPDGQKLRFELEKTWDLATRWKSWQKRERTFNRDYDNQCRMQETNRKLQDYIDSLSDDVESNSLVDRNSFADGLRFQNSKGKKSIFEAIAEIQLKQ